MICRCSLFQCSRGNARRRSRSVRSTLLPFDRPQRQASRWMWVSTGNDGTPKACAMTTLAVLWPTPGRRSRASRSAGTRPPCSTTSCRDRPEIAFAFCGASPHERIAEWISSTGNRAMASGVRAFAKSPGVTLLTRSSVHCAESSTATSSVNASSCASGTAGSGNRASSSAWIREVFSCRRMRANGIPGGGPDLIVFVGSEPRGIAGGDPVPVNPRIPGPGRGGSVTVGLSVGRPGRPTALQFIDFACVCDGVFRHVARRSLGPAFGPVESPGPSRHFLRMPVARRQSLPDGSASTGDGTRT
jgi:hypothetical protein